MGSRQMLSGAAKTSGRDRIVVGIIMACLFVLLALVVGECLSVLPWSLPVLIGSCVLITAGLFALMFAIYRWACASVERL